MGLNSTYEIDSAFEAGAVTLLCSSPRLFGRIGQFLSPELMTCEQATLAMQAARAIFQATGEGPRSTVSVMQRLRRWRQDGRITHERICAVADYFDRAEDSGLPSPEEVVSEIAPILQERLREQAVREAMTAHGKKADLAKAVALEEEAKRIGRVDTSVGIVVGEESLDEIREHQQLDCLPFRIPELDSLLGGGLRRGCLGILLGSSGDGKSMGLCHIAGISVLSGLNVAVAVLELPRPMWQGRLLSCMTNIPIDTVMESSSNGQVKDALRKLNGIGKCIVRDFPPQVTTVPDLIEWIKIGEERIGAPFDVVVVDYGDRLTATGLKEMNTYETGKRVYEALRTYARDTRKFVWTASQATRRRIPGRSKHILTIDDIADSMWKVRVGDTIISINLDEDASEVVFFIAKHLAGVSRKATTPLPVDYAYGRLAPIC